MASIQATVANNVVTLDVTGEIIAGEVNISKLSATFDSAWDGLTIFAVFTQMDTVKKKQYEDGMYVPWECMAKPRPLFIGFVGYDSDGVLRIPTIVGEPVRVYPGTQDDEEAADPTPNDLVRVMNLVAKLEAGEETRQADFEESQVTRQSTFESKLSEYDSDISELKTEYESDLSEFNTKAADIEQKANQSISEINTKIEESETQTDLAKSATSAAISAKNEAIDAASAANSAAASVNTAIDNSNKATKNANDAASSALAATSFANNAASNANEKAEIAETSASDAEQAAQEAKDAAQEAKESASGMFPIFGFEYPNLTVSMPEKSNYSFFINDDGVLGVSIDD